VLVERAVERRLAGARADAVRDVDRLIEATYAVAQREGTVEPTLRAILREAGLSTEAFYRHFSSKDELLLVVLADGRHRLTGYLAHRMERADEGFDRVQAWIEGVMAQAADPVAASRTKPFLANLGRLTERFPGEMARSVDAMVDPLHRALDAAVPPAIRPRDRRSDAMAVYRLALSAMQTHVLSGTAPSEHEVDHLVAFCRRGVME
jgi:AcrR family transcriptional regulator